MAGVIKGGLPPDLVLASGYRVRLLALDSSTFAEIGGVNLTDVAFFVTDLLDAATPTDPGAVPSPLLVPSEGFD